MRLPHTIIAITVKQMIASISRNGVNLFGGIAHCGKEQTMSKYINVEWLLGVAKLSNGVVDIDDIYNAPSIDIVFCKDCISADEKPIADGRYWCNSHGCYMRFCSDGEREGE